MPHFTYQEPNKNTLNQGDVLQKTTRICDILEAVHPHYLNIDYTHFIVLTQTCDLQQRGTGVCKSPYISIAAIRPLTTVLNRYVAQFQESIFEKKSNIIRKEEKYKIHNFLSRLLNNNESDYFYLHEDLNYGLSESSVAFLRLSVALKSDLHYKSCLESKSIELTEGFRAKLGWLVGNMYSRVGTPDWVPTVLPKKEEFKEKVDKILNEYYRWVEKERIDILIKVLKKEKGEIEKEEIIQRLDSISLTPPSEIIINRIKNILQESKVEKEEVDKISFKISNDPTIRGILGG